MSIFVLEDVGASTPGTPLRLRFDSVGDTEVDFLVDDAGGLHIRPQDGGSFFLGVKGSAAGEVEFEVFEGTFEDDLRIQPANASTEQRISFISSDASLAIGQVATLTALSLLATTARNNFMMFRTRHSGTAPLGWELDYSGASPRGSLNNFLTFTDSTGTLLECDSDGDLTNLNGNYGTISDRNMKQDIVDADPQSQWDDIKAMRFRKFKMKDEVAAKGEDGAKLCLGLVAQELQDVSPGLVKTSTKRVVVTETVDPDSGLTSVDKEHFDDGPPVLSTKSSILYMKGMVALQEAMRRIEVLEAAAAP